MTVYTVSIPGTKSIASGSTRVLYGDANEPGILPTVPGVSKVYPDKSPIDFPYLILVENGSSILVLGAESHEATLNWRSADLPDGIRYEIRRFVVTTPATEDSKANGHFAKVD